MWQGGRFNPYAKPPAGSVPTSSQNGGGQAVPLVSRKDQLLDPIVASTRASVNSAVELFNAFQRQRNDPVMEELRPEDVIDTPEELLLHDEDDKGKMFYLLGNFAFWLVENPPTKGSGTNTALKSGTVGQYFSSVKGELAQRFPGPFNFEKVEDDWYSPLRKQLENRMMLRELTGGSDVGVTKCNGLYWVHNHSVDRQQDTVVGATDLMTVNRNLLRSNQTQACSKVLLQTLAYSAAGRGGETKYQHYDDWFWDNYLDVLETLWRETKTLKTHIMTFCNDNGLWMCDIFVLFALFFALENGLHRNLPAGTDASKVPSKFKHVFHGDQMQPASWFARRITNTLREFIAPCLKPFTSSRSLRKAPSVLLSIHPQISHGARLARCGWAAGDSSDSYTPETVASSLPGMKILAGWNSAVDPVHAPRFSSLLEVCTSDQVQAFIDAIYVVSLGEFHQGGRLCMVLEVCTASVLMHFKEITMEPGKGRCMADKMVSAAVKCGLATTPSLAIQLLCSWADIVRQDWDQRNSKVDETKDGTELLQELLAVNKEQQQTIRAMNLQHEAFQQKMSENFELLIGEVFQLKEALKEANSPVSRKRQVSQLEEDGDHVDDDLVKNSGNKKAIQDKKQSAVSLVTELLMNSGGTPQPLEGGSIIISSLLVEMHKTLSTRLGKKPSTIHLPKYKETPKMVHCMKFVEHVWTVQDQVMLRDPTIPREKLISVCNSIEAKAVKKRCDLEGVSTARFKPYYIGMGAGAGKWLSDHNGKFE